MANVQWLDGNKIQVEPPKKPLKITGTRFAAIMGLNRWNTPFKVWCEITRTYKEPFEDTVYTIAGKTIEPKQAEYMRTAYFMRNLVTPTDKFGEDYFKVTHGDFFPNMKVVGGAWDYILTDSDGNPTGVLEMKTTKRAEDWAEDIPEYYALQAALYAYLLGVEQVIMVCSILGDKDYEHPENFVPSAKNTIVRPFSLHERYPDMEQRIAEALKWWKHHVETGISPAYDEKADADILKALRANNLSPDIDIAVLLAEAETLKKHIDTVKATVSYEEKRLKTVTDMIKEYGIDQFRDGDKNVIMSGPDMNWIITKTNTTKIDQKAMKADGVFDKYSTVESSYRITTKEKE